MITITLQYDKNNRLSGFQIRGHADYDESGSDIVCAAVSVLAQTALLGLLEYAGEESITYGQDDGFLSVHVKKSVPEAEVILHTMVLGLQEIVRQYGEYVAFGT
ncbi:ribosomal-processing cysteine protease Prp [Megasphaera hominis]|jgi:uncharacterized protein YsxB (DUF464 family)|uniref:Ribosomal processing cysteine protease Prp n=1 Tax=Megasphaera hominis TaxID=159836 RepID=A0ABR6VGP8_9FIRM|nr:ribosomal-processing cysteine protease Prp [Megasphaera hominis]MBC3536416.1 ribosomal-processing cysteine protease Prp [Megasphaera hominis]